MQMKEKLDSRMQRTVKKVGKQDMIRSEKEALKKKEVTKEVPEELQDQLYYLGEEFDKLAELAQ